MEIIKDIDGDGISEVLVSSVINNEVYLFYSKNLFNLFGKFKTKNLNISDIKDTYFLLKGTTNGERNFGRSMTINHEKIVITSLGLYIQGIIYEFSMS